MNDFSTILGHQLIKTNDFSNYYDLSEDLSNRIKNLKSNFFNIESFIDELHSKNYTYAGISRVLCHIMLEILQNDVTQFINNDYFDFVRILGFKRH